MFFLGCPVVIAYSLVTSCVRVLMKRKWIFSFYLDKHFPKKQIKLRHNCRKPWLTTGLKNAIKTKNKLYKKSLMIRCCHNQITYKIYRNKLKHILIKEEKSITQIYLNLTKVI